MVHGSDSAGPGPVRLISRYFEKNREGFAAPFVVSVEKSQEECNMQTKRLILLAISVLAAIGIGYFIGQRNQDEDLKAGVVRSYDVPVDQAESIKGSINQLLKLKDGESYGRAQVFDNGLMLVVAPKGYQQGIQRMVQTMSAQKSKPRQVIHLDYWLVTGQEDASSNDKAFGDLAPVLATIAKLDGSRKFKILEHISNNSSPNEEVFSQGSFAKVTSTPSVVNGAVLLKLDFNSDIGKLKGNSQLTPGEFYVLGQSAVEPGKHLGSMTLPSNSNVYYIVRATLLK
jgi:hypothetical protein